MTQVVQGPLGIKQELELMIMAISFYTLHFNLKLHVEQGQTSALHPPQPLPGYPDKLLKVRQENLDFC